MTTRSSYGYLTVEPTRQMSTSEVILFENYCQNTKPDPVPYFGPPKWSVQWEEKLRKAPEVYRYPNTRIFLQHSVGIWKTVSTPKTGSIRPAVSTKQRSCDRQTDRQTDIGQQLIPC